MEILVSSFWQHVLDPEHLLFFLIGISLGLILHQIYEWLDGR